MQGCTQYWLAAHVDVPQEKGPPSVLASAGGAGVELPLLHARQDRTRQQAASRQRGSISYAAISTASRVLPTITSSPCNSSCSPLMRTNTPVREPRSVKRIVPAVSSMRQC